MFAKANPFKPHKGFYMSAITNVTRLGATNNAVSTEAAIRSLFLKVFPGEVMGAFNEANLMFGSNGSNGYHKIRDIDSGKEAQFPATGIASASYHVAGAELQGQIINHAERTISIDSMLIADVFINDFDEAMSHFQVRGEYATQLGHALALKADKQLFQVAVLAARSSATVTGLSGGSAVTNAAAKTDGEVLASLIYDAAQTLDEKNVPSEDRFVGVKPAQFYLMVQTTKLLNRDWGGRGSFATADLPTVADISVLKTNNLPTTNIASAETGVSSGNTYHGDFSKTAGVVWTPEAMGSVRLVGLKTESDYLIRNQGTLALAKYAMGHGILRPECAVEIATP